MRRIVLFSLAVWIVVVVLGSASLSAQEAVRPSSGVSTLFDPFELRTILLSDNPSEGQSVSPPGLAKDQSRRPIRVPFRLPVRSAYKPGQG